MQCIVTDDSQGRVSAWGIEFETKIIESVGKEKYA